MKYSINDIKAQLIEIACNARIPEKDAEVMVDSLITAESWGIYSHGLERFPIYIKRLREGLVNPQPSIEIKHRMPTIIQVNGDNGLGSVVMRRAEEEAIRTADVYGSAVAVIRKSNHFSAAGYYVNRIASQGYIAMICSVGPANMPPYGGMEPYFSTNPIAIAMPRKSRPNIVVDMATSVAAKGKIRAMARLGKPIPEGWAIDKNGYPTTDANAAIEGMVIPMAGHKGSALALAVEHLAGVSSGSAFGTDVVMQYGDEKRPADVGHSLVIYKIDGLMDREEYFARTELFCNQLHAIKPAPGFEKVILPGEIEFEREEKAIREGLEIDDDLYRKIQNLR